MNKKHSKVSVVITTYNGEKYILEQLESIRKQTLKPDEVLIRDDLSTDGTYKKVCDYIATNKLENWKVIKGTTNVGWKVNFKNVIELATGDIIFLCDQDDVWSNNKLKIMISIMENNPYVELLASECDFLISGKIHKKKNKSKLLEQHKFDSHFFHTTKPGAVYAVRKRLINELKPYWNVELPHDAQLWVLASLRKTLYVCNIPLILYRRHSETATGREDFAINTKMRNVKYEELLLWLTQRYEGDNRVLTLQEKTILIKAQKYVQSRKDLFDKRNISAVISILPYFKYYISLKTMIGDIIITMVSR